MSETPIPFLDFVRTRCTSGGLTTDDALAAFLPLARRVAAVHTSGRVAPLKGTDALSANGSGITFDEAKLSPPRLNPSRIRELDPPPSTLDVTVEGTHTADTATGDQSFADLRVATPDSPLTKPVYLRSYVAWEQAADHQDPLTDTFSLGMILASLTLGLDFTDEKDLRTFAGSRHNLFALQQGLHPVVAKAITRMTELSRHRRAQDLPALIQSLENYRDQEVDLEIDLARIKGFHQRDRKGKRQILMGKLRERLFEISRQNRLLHHRPTLQTVNLTFASVPLTFDLKSIKPEQLLTWRKDLQAQVVSGEPISLNKYLRFEDNPYLPSVLDKVRTEASRDTAEFGFAQLRLVICFLRWADLKASPPERYDSPLILLPVQLQKRKGVRDAYVLDITTAEAEVNPVLRFFLKDLYNINLPETIDLAETDLDAFYEALKTQVVASEPGITLEKIDRPKIELIHAKAKRRLDDFQRRLKAGRKQSSEPMDYSYARDRFQPLGLKLFHAKVKPARAELSRIVEDTPRPRLDGTEPVQEKGRTFAVFKEEGARNTYAWDFDLCNLTLGNFRYRKVSLVRDYDLLLEGDHPNAPFDSVFSLEPRPAPSELPPLPLEERFPVVPSDPTQASAIARARTGQSYIIQGPPGTGKSQTITNLIADYLARGLRVLFVCEKRAAIDVVYHRLQQAGLHEMCCLIHDSQEDKKAFVMDMKACYEKALQMPESERKDGEINRRRYLEGIRREIEPLGHFHRRMQETPENSGLPLRHLLERLVDLREAIPDLSPVEQERMPLYRFWLEHRERIGHLIEALKDANEDPILAAHPLQPLRAALVEAERPLEAVHTKVTRIRDLLDRIEGAIRSAGLPPDPWGSLEPVRDLMTYAASVQGLAKRGLVALLDPESPVSREFDGRVEARRRRAQALEKLKEPNKPWRDRLTSDDAQAALDQARGLEGFLAFLKPGFWRLRKILHARFDFSATVVKPTWTRLLQNLVDEQRLEAEAREADAEAGKAYALQGSFEDFAASVAGLRDQLASCPPPLKAFHASLAAASGQEAKVAPLAGARRDLDPLATEIAALFEEPDQPFPRIREALGRIEKALDRLPAFLPVLSALKDLPAPLADAIRRAPFGPLALEAAMADRTLDDTYRGDLPLSRFSGRDREGHVRRLDRYHRDWLTANADCVADRVRMRFYEHVALSQRAPSQLTPEQQEFKKRYNTGRRDLEHEFGKSMRYKSIRDLAGGPSGDVIRDLKPVWLMSPLSVADTLPLEACFDVVIFDEASQITLESAVPTLFRAPQVIVVGDQMQLPPTDFFSVKRDEGETLAVEEGDRRAEYDLDRGSLLSHATRNLESTMLGWHYRSRSESLISFSNAAFYQGRLLTVPDARPPKQGLSETSVTAPVDAEKLTAEILDRGVSFHLLPGGTYVDRRNTAEADHLAALVRAILKRGEKLSLGIVAFSEAQQGEIEAALERLAAQDPEFRGLLEAEYAREEDGQFVGLLVKNLENVQGDERDIILLSVCYGPGPDGRMLMNFGPINQSGGEKRLNVAFSRAKRHMVVVSSIRPEQITNDYNDGAHCLKSYLRFSMAMSSGDLPAARRILTELSARRDESRKEERIPAAAREMTVALRAQGYEVDTAVGQSSFRCDLAVRCPGDREYKLGVLVDSDLYYAQADALGRDVLRPGLLKAFGWRVVMITAKDWFQDRDWVLERLERALDDEEEAEPEIELPPLPPEPVAPPPVVASAPKRYFECTEKGSSKFWEVAVTGKDQVVRFGRIGSAGQVLTKTFPDPAAADRDTERMIQEKLRKGYKEKGATDKASG